MAAVPKRNPKRFYWWRLRKNFFTQITIKKLRRSENGDTKAIIYLQMVLMTIDNDGYIQYEGIENDICDEIAIALDEDSDIIKETVEQLKDMGLIEISEENYFLPEAKSGIDSESVSAERVRKYRANKKVLQCNDCVTESNAPVTASNEEVTNCNTQVTQRRGEKRRVREEERREDKRRVDKEIERELYTNSTVKTESKLLEPDEIVNMFNVICKSYEPVRNYMIYSKALSTCICLGYTKQDYKQAFTNVENSDYLKGLTESKTFQSTFDWILEHLEEVKNGKYN